MLIFFNIIVFILVLIIIKYLARYLQKLSLIVAVGLALGTLFGLALQLIYGPTASVLIETLRWINIVGNGYISLLQMIVMPLIFISILGAVSRISSVSILGKIGAVILLILLFTVSISALIGNFLVNLFHLDAKGLLEGYNESFSDSFNAKIETIEHFHPADFILSFIPKNPFLALSGGQSNAVIAVVIFTSFLGVAALLVKREDAQKGAYIDLAVDVVQAWVMKLTQIVIRLSPYGIAALMTRVAASSQITDIAKLADFLILSYVGIGLIFVVHGFLLWFFGINPLRFFEKIMPVLVFAFTSRSSSATIPMNVETQIKRLKISPTIANFTASFGSTIGQNGCAGLYPAMLASMTAPVLGIDIANFHWIAMMVAIVALSSIGVAGVGGGATFAALIVLPNLGLPVTLVVILISIEPLIDMGRTAVNVSGAMVAGAITDKLFYKKKTISRKD